MVAIKQLKEQIHNVLKQHDVRIAYLFGSAARGTMGAHSDLDIAVLFCAQEAASEERIQQEGALIQALERQTGKQVDLINLQEVRSPLLRHRAIRRGELVYCVDDKLRQSLELRALHDYEDTQHLRAVQKKAMYNRIESGTFGKPQ